MNMIPRTMVLLPTRNGLRLAGGKTNKLEAKPEHKRTNEPAVIYRREGWQRDCTQILDLL
jgi:hypothetical protein